MLGSAGRLRITVGLAGGATAAAAMLGAGAAQAAPAGNEADAAATAALAAAASTGSGVDGSWLFGAAPSGGDVATTDTVDLLANAATNLSDAGDVLTALEFGNGGMGNRLDSIAAILTDRLEPAQDAILAHSGVLAGLVEQLFLAPLNQQWFDTSEAFLGAAQALESTTIDGSASWGTLTALLELNNVIWFQMIPVALASVPVGIIGDLFADTAGAAVAGSALGLFDLPF